MIKNYFKVALRNLVKNKAHSAINIVGLAVGLAVAILIGLWIWDEMTYNKWHRNYDRLAQVMTTQTFNDQTGTGPAIAIPLANELRTMHGSDFKYVSLASWNFEHILAVGEKKITQEGMWAEAELPGILTLQMIEGSRNSLVEPNVIILTESLAKSLFGREPAINKVVRIDNKTDMKVVGVFRDLPRNSSFYEMKFLMPWQTYITTQPWLKEAQTQWGNHSFQMFVQLQDGSDFARTTQKIKDIPKKHVQEGKEEIVLQPMKNWHLYNEFKNGKVVGGRIQFIWLFGTIGVFVMLLACINFMNLSTARSEKRAREVGIRKAVGSLRQQLVGQFLSESTLVSLFALLVSIILVLLALPFFNSLADKEMRIPWLNPFFWLIAILFAVATGFVSGSYPAFYLSSFNPVKVLKGTFKAGRYAGLPRKMLVVVQFSVSVTLIIGTIIVFRQIQHAKDRPVGYSREGLITVMMNTPDLHGKYNAVRSELLNTGVVDNVSQSSSPSTGVWSNQIGFDWKGKDPNSVPLFGIVAVSHDYGKTLQWTVDGGRDFSRDFKTDTGALILNEAAVKLTGLKQPVGEIITWNDNKHEIVGVVKDMVMESPYMPIKPTIFFLEYGWASVITIRIKPTIPIRQALSRIEPVFRQFNPGSPFDYKFTDEQYARKFEDEERIGNLATFLAFLAIFISCLGLFGLASFIAEQRTKEIGVRKVLGASVFDLWQMMSKDFVALVVISCCIAVPIAWYFLSGWLQQYEYRTKISWWIFAVAGLGALLITVLTVSFQAIRAAIANPIRSLRSE